MLFGESDFYLAFRRKVVPMLKTYPSVRVWVAGCQSGEVPYELAIILEEEGIKKFHIYTTDGDGECLERAEKRMFSLASLKKGEKNYLATHGKNCLENYFSARGSRARLCENLKKNISFFQYHIETDGSFNEFHSVFCRQMLSRFDEGLRARAYRLIYDSLAKSGVLWLGRRDSLQGSMLEGKFKAIDPMEGFYKKVA